MEREKKQAKKRRQRAQSGGNTGKKKSRQNDDEEDVDALSDTDDERKIRILQGVASGLADRLLQDPKDSTTLDKLMRVMETLENDYGIVDEVSTYYYQDNPMHNVAGRDGGARRRRPASMVDESYEYEDEDEARDRREESSGRRGGSSMAAAAASAPGSGRKRPLDTGSRREPLPLRQSRDGGREAAIMMSTPPLSHFAHLPSHQPAGPPGKTFVQDIDGNFIAVAAPPPHHGDGERQSRRGDYHRRLRRRTMGHSRVHAVASKGDGFR